MWCLHGADGDVSYFAVSIFCGDEKEHNDALCSMSGAPDQMWNGKRGGKCLFASFIPLA